MPVIPSKAKAKATLGFGHRHVVAAAVAGAVAQADKGREHLWWDSGGTPVGAGAGSRGWNGRGQPLYFTLPVSGRALKPGVQIDHPKN